MVFTVFIEAGELIKISYKFQSLLQEFWVEAMEALTDVTKLFESIGHVESEL